MLLTKEQILFAEFYMDEGEKVTVFRKINLAVTIEPNRVKSVLNLCQNYYLCS